MISSYDIKEKYSFGMYNLLLLQKIVNLNLFLFVKVKANRIVLSK